MLLLALTLACVPKKDFDALSADLAAEKAAHAMTKATLAQRETTLGEAEAEVARLKAEEARLQADLAAAKAAMAAAEAAWDGEKAALVSDRSQLKASVAEMEGALREAAERRAEAEKRVAEFRDLLGRFKKLIDAGQLKVQIVDGRMVVVLATDILFASGKAELSDGGKASLTEVGAVLASLGDRSFQVEGHTDDVPIATERFPSNWELASARSILVVKTLIGAGVKAQHVSAASFAETHPIGDNTSPEGRKANRRIEIVVVPDLSTLPGFDELQKVGG